MKRLTCILALATLSSVPAMGQTDPVDKLREVLPADIVDQVIAQVEAARAQELPAQAMANIAMEGIAKGRSAEEVLGAVEQLGIDLSRAREALQNGDAGVEGGNLEAATAAVRMGVDPEAVSALAQSQPLGRSLAVPLLVLGGLAERGLSSGDALAAVRARLEAGVGDPELLGDFPEVAQGLGQGMTPEELGTALAGGFAGFEVPVAGIAVPVGPAGQEGIPSDLPGRGRGERPGGF